MPSYLIAYYKVTNPEGYSAYLAEVGATIASHQGKVLVAGPGSTPIEGNPEPVTIVLQFPSRNALQGWYDSPEYQAIIHKRIDNTEGSLVFADEFAMPA